MWPLDAGDSFHYMHMLCTLLSKQGTVPILCAAMCGGGPDGLRHGVEPDWIKCEPGQAALVFFEFKPFGFEVGVRTRVAWKTFTGIIIGISIITARCAG